MITVYSKNNCMACKMTKNWLKDNGFSYKETNVDDDLNALTYLIENNLRTMPVVFKDSDLLALGFQPDKLKTLL